jgi:hypothetical protein
VILMILDKWCCRCKHVYNDENDIFCTDEGQVEPARCDITNRLTENEREPGYLKTRILEKVFHMTICGKEGQYYERTTNDRLQ